MGCCSRTRLATTPRFVGFAPQHPLAKSHSFVYHPDALAAEQVFFLINHRQFGFLFGGVLNIHILLIQHINFAASLERTDVKWPRSDCFSPFLSFGDVAVKNRAAERFFGDETLTRRSSETHLLKINLDAHTVLKATVRLRDYELKGPQLLAESKHVTNKPLDVAVAQFVVP
jgi:hypothetical protein